MNTKQLPHYFAYLVLLLFGQYSKAQLGVNDTNSPPASNAILDVKSATKGMIIPRITTTNRNALSGEGMVVFDTDTKTFWFHNGTIWVNNWVNSGTKIYNGNAGNVGIGTNNPTAKLDLNGSLKIANGTQGNAKVLTSDANGLATWQVLPTASGFPLNIPEIVNWKGVFVASTSYALNDLVNSSSPNVYFYSLTASNLAHTPESSPSFWQAVSFHQLKQIYKPLPLLLQQTAALFSFPDATISFRGKLTFIHTITVSSNGLVSSSAETNFQYLKNTTGSSSGSNTDESTRFGIGLGNTNYFHPNFQMSSGIVSIATAAGYSGVGRFLLSNGIYFRLMPLGGNPAEPSTPTNILLIP